MSILASHAGARGEYFAVAECGAKGRHDPLCAYHAIVLGPTERDAEGGLRSDLRTSMSLTSRWDAIDGYYGTPEDATMIAALIREAKEGVEHKCANTAKEESVG